MSPPVHVEGSPKLPCNTGLGTPSTVTIPYKIAQVSHARPRSLQSVVPAVSVPVPRVANSDKPLLHIRHAERFDPTWACRTLRVDKKLGCGSFGVVLHVKDELNCSFALKVLDKAEYRQRRSWHLLNREVALHASLVHPNIARLHALFHDSAYVYLALEYAPQGDLIDALLNMERRGQRVSEKAAARITLQVARALRFCHAHGIVHRDVKPENILLGRGGVAKLADFGWSICMRQPEKLGVVGGTRQFRAPEIWQDKEYGAPVDLWALGVVVFQMLFARMPFHEDRVRHWWCWLTFPNTPEVSHDAKDLVRGLLRRNPAKRLTAKDVLVHPWIRRLR